MEVDSGVLPSLNYPGTLRGWSWAEGGDRIGIGNYLTNSHLLSMGWSCVKCVDVRTSRPTENFCEFI